MNLKYVILPLLILSFTGCNVIPKEINLDEKPAKQVAIKVKKQQRNYKGTLYSRAGASLFSDKKDLQIGDILQVNISESLKNNTKNSRSLSKKNTTALGGGVFVPTTGVVNTAGTAARMAGLNNGLGVGFNTTSSNTFTGSANSQFDEKFSTIISAVIIEVYQNGNYFIKGNKELLINNQQQLIGISGIIRPYDISPDNTVLSSQIANLKILYFKDGEEVDALSKSWGTKLIEFIWPF
jgi:flagellar L-ring protein precursor FlgH